MYHPERVDSFLPSGPRSIVVYGDHAPLLNEQTWGMVMVSSRRQKEQIAQGVCVNLEWGRPP